MVGTNYLTGTNYAFGGNIGPTFMPPNPFIPVLGSKGEKGLNGATALRSTSSETALLPDPALDAYTPIRIPLHEPWKSHENLNQKILCLQKQTALQENYRSNRNTVL